MANEITRISVKGFKSLAKECSIEIRPLTILAGANSSGKSSIMQPLLMMKQTLDATHDPGALLINGPNIRFTLADQFFSKIKGGASSNKFQICIEIENTLSMCEVFQKSLKGGIDIDEINYYVKDHPPIILNPNMTREEIISSIPKDPILFTDSFADILEFKIERRRFFLKPIGYIGDEKGPRTTFNPSTPIEPFSDSIQKIIHVRAFRGNPERNYNLFGTGPLFPGTFENYVASVINNWQTTMDERLQFLGNDLEILGLTWKVEAKAVDDTQVELLVGRLPKNMEDTTDLVSIADVGFGISQVLPIIVALLVAESGQLVYIEQPEIHLHPRAQVALPQLLAKAADNGVRVVVETHSSLLLLGIQALVAEGKLSPDKVKLHWFKRRPQDGVTEVTSADLDDAGAFGDWPEDFSSAEMDADTRYIHAAEARLE